MSGRERLLLSLPPELREMVLATWLQNKAQTETLAQLSLARECCKLTRMVVESVFEKEADRRGAAAASEGIL